MGLWMGLWSLLSGILSILYDVALFWEEVCCVKLAFPTVEKLTLFEKYVSWWRSRSPRDQLLYELSNAETFEDWEETAFRLDELLSADLWRQNPTSKQYDYRLILQRLESIISARENEDALTLVNLLRSGLVRNLGNITSSKLFNRAYAGTKLLIDDYITQVALSIQHVTALQTIPIHASGFTSQAKLELLHDTRQAFGRTSLVLQGGSAFGLCHLGIIKALHLRGLLPRIITGTATGALVAALVGVHTEDELLDFLNSDKIDLTAFGQQNSGASDGKKSGNWLQKVIRSLRRYFKEGSLLDVKILEECVRANVGDMTFEEAYAKSKRILNITVAASGKGTFPNLLNYLTAPNVLVWSAALASNASSSSALYSPVTLYCKDESGAIVPWPHTQDVTFRSWHQVNLSGRESPLARLAELFNVNHFIVSQTRPFAVPFLYTEPSPAQRLSGHRSLTRPLMRLVMLEIRHRLKQLDYLGFLPASLRQLLVDENIPGPSLILIPDLNPSDLLKIFQGPTKTGLDYWILRGERGVWPAVSALKVRCAIEIELDRCYQTVRRRRSTDINQQTGGTLTSRHGANEGVPRKRRPSGQDLD
ncbi:putative triacylglycerol lipase C1450,16c [Talaromyces islandicus]|uniref:Putative triacylglycerol lipase C1450,16c n=1 Tax=Talaromyces islandicus TaxID=28573 RepID=A0A0U1LQH9_TALIS|nr:putative triacylglycerol lipase C1450,16c [Talaromyces islandicus]